MIFKSDIDYRKQKLKALLNSILEHENDIISALYNDFKKPEFEAVITETSYVISDLKNTIKNLDYTVYFPAASVAEIVEKTGIKERRFALPGTCSSDLCFAAAEK